MFPRKETCHGRTFLIQRRKYLLRKADLTFQIVNGLDRHNTRHHLCHRCRVYPFLLIHLRQDLSVADPEQDRGFTVQTAQFDVRLHPLHGKNSVSVSGQK